ncbi:MAG: TRAP transporter permease [Oscillospiraceae bacterium]
MIRTGFDDSGKKKTAKQTDNNVTEPDPVPIDEKTAISEKMSKLSKPTYIILAILSVLYLSFQVYVKVIYPLDKWIQLPLHLCISLIIVFLYKPLANKYKKKFLWAVDVLLIAGSCFVLYYFVTNVEYLNFRVLSVDPMTTMDLIAAYVLLVILMEAVRRSLGLTLFFVILFFITYAFLGQHLSGTFQFSGMTWKQFGELLTMSLNGIFGSPLSISASTIFYFMIFGAFFSTCGGGQVLIDLGMKLSNKTVGGPAKAAVLSSGLMGMISGSAVANVTTTGVLTIPLMKRTGYTPEEAGAIEAVASTGGQIMPPIMGAGAFIMAEMIGISYAKIALSALIPALGYYLAIFLVVHMIAKKKSLTKAPEAAIKTPAMLPRLYRLLPMIIVVVLIFMGYSLPRCALIGTALSIIIGAFSKETRMTIKQYLNMLMDGIRQATNIVIPTAACGIMIGIVIRSGAAVKIAKLIATSGNESLLLALIITLIGCILLGMALPTVAAYLIANVLFCSSIQGLGVEALVANMFIFYFGVVAQITPPVCLASFTAAGISGGSSWKTGWKAFTFALAGFLVPFIFIYDPSILLIGSVPQIIYSSAVLAIGIYFLACAVTGYQFKILNPIERSVLIAAALMMIIPEHVSDLIGFLIGIGMLVFNIMKSRQKNEKKKIIS